MALRRVLSKWLCAGTCLALFPVSAWAESVAFAQVPPAVQKGIQAQVANGTIGQIARNEDEEGEVLYTVSITKEGRSREFTLNEAGVLVSMEVLVTETPMLVLRTIQGAVKGGKIESVEKVLDAEGTRYDVEWKTTEGAARSCSVLESGKLESLQVALEETPAAVQAAIAKEAGAAQVKEIIWSSEDNAVYYDVTVNRDGKDRDFTVAAGGKLESRQVFMAEIPAAAQKTIERVIGQGKVLRIDQVFDKKKGVFPFEVEARVDGKPYDFSVGPKGLFLGVD